MSSPAKETTADSEAMPKRASTKSALRVSKSVTPKEREGSMSKRPSKSKEKTPDTKKASRSSEARQKKDSRPSIKNPPKTGEDDKTPKGLQEGKPEELKEEGASQKGKKRQSEKKSRSPEKVPGESGKDEEQKDAEISREDDVKKDELNKALYQTEASKFNPQVYSFTSPVRISTRKSVVVECPPFWVLLDHALAVVWKLYSPQADPKGLGIVQLQWALEFLSSMKGDTGELTQPIAEIVMAIEDALIDRYAKVCQEKGKRKEDTNKDDVKQDESTPSICNPEASITTVTSESNELSYTLKDLMATDIPTYEDKERVKNESSPAVKKVGFFKPPDDQNMKKEDIIEYIMNLKREQSEIIAKEKAHAEKLKKVLDMVKNENFDANNWLSSRKAKRDERTKVPDDSNQKKSSRRDSSDKDRREGATQKVVEENVDEK